MQAPSTFFFGKLICEARYFLTETNKVQTEAIDGHVHSFRTVCDGV